MSQVQQLAKQGDPKAIAALINQSFNPKGLSVRAAVKGSCLQILVQSANPINQQAVVSFISKGLNTLAPQGITRVRICAQQTDEVTPAWVEEVQLGSLPSSLSTPAPTASTLSTSMPLSEQLQPNSGTLPHSQQEDDALRCPRCTSAQVILNKKGFSGGKAVAGAVLLGPLGLAGGFIGANKTRLNCLKCGFQWDAGKPKLPVRPAVPAVSSSLSPSYPPDAFEQASTHTLVQKPKPIKAKLVRVSLELRVAMGVFLGLTAGVFIAFWIGSLSVSQSGMIIGVVMLVSGLLGAVFRDLGLSLSGTCPYCGKEATITYTGIPVECPHCKNKIKTQYDGIRTAWFYQLD